MPKPLKHVFVCSQQRPNGHPRGSCAQKGSEDVLKRLKEALIKRGAHKRIRACGSGCLDLCEIGAAVLQEPDHVAYGKVTLDDVEELADCVVEGRVCERLVVFPEKAP